MVYTKPKITFIDAGDLETSRIHRSTKSNWKIELVKKGVGVIQHISPRKASEIVWYHFTKPGKSRFTPAQEKLLAQAEVRSSTYLGHEIICYKWGSKGPRVLLSHGWSSKIADFRRMIEYLVGQGFVVEGIDMKAHGRSTGKHTALPEIRDILKNHYIKNGPYDSVVGYSMGGLAAGVFLSEIAPQFQPRKLFVIGSPSHSRYFFKDVIKQLGYTDKVYNEMCDLVIERYHESVDYFDLRSKKQELTGIDIYLIYDENDETVPIVNGDELRTAFPNASFVHSRGLGHFKIISFTEIIKYISDQLRT